MTYRFSERAQNIGASLIRQMFNYAARDVQGYISLGVGVPSFPLPKHVATELAATITSNPHINKYFLGKGLPPLSQAVAKKLERKNIYVDPEREILTTAGSAGGIFCTLMAIVEEGDEVIVPSPAYSNHTEVIRFAGGKPIYVPLLEDKRWQLDINGIGNAITDRTKAIVICNPSNPTGAIFPEKDLRAVGEMVRERDLYILEDDAYEFLTYDGSHFSLRSVPELKDWVISFFTPSKEHAMTGFRVGWVVGNTDLIDKVFDVQDQNYICAPSISQYAALAALTGPQDHVEQFKKELSRRRDVICGRLDRLSSALDYQKPQGAYYVFPRLHQDVLERKARVNGKASERLEEIPERLRTRDTELALKLLYDVGVVTVPGISFGPEGENHLRFSFAAEEEVIQETFDRIEKWLGVM